MIRTDGEMNRNLGESQSLLLIKSLISHLRARPARRTGLAVGPLPRQTAVRCRGGVVRPCDAARPESDAWNRDTRPLAPRWVRAFRHERAIDGGDLVVAVDERVLLAHEEELVGLETGLTEPFGRRAEPVRVLPRAHPPHVRRSHILWLTGDQSGGCMTHPTAVIVEHLPRKCKVQSESRLTR
jgi:hypothetical protein